MAGVMMDELGLSVKYRHLVHNYFGNDTSNYNMMYIPRGSQVKQWNGLNTNFFSLDPTIPVKVYMCAIFYLGPIDYTIASGRIQFDHETNEENHDYWDIEAQRQLGTHVFVNRYGNIMSITTNLVLPFYEYMSFSQSSINAIYPVIRVEPNPWMGDRLELKLTLALLYRYYRDEYNEDGTLVVHNPLYRYGDRRYCRLRRFNPRGPVCTAGGVYEINEDEFEWCRNESIPQRRQQPYSYSYCAFYVCAGAKLMVYDEYNEDITNMSHNRSLVQQGGLVIVEGCWFQLAIGLAERGFYYLNTAQDSGVLTSGPPIPESCIQNPVIFLGPNDSEYQSIAWDLSIRRNRNNNNRKNCYLNIPEGGRIVAIEEWNVGMAEVRARQLYERLHESTLTVTHPTQLMSVGFQVPDEQMLNKILGIAEADGQQRHYDCHILADQRLADVAKCYSQIKANQSELPRQFNTYRCNQVNYNQVQHHATSGWVPPMFPPFYQTTLEEKFQSNPSKFTTKFGLIQMRNKRHKIISPYYVRKDGQNILYYKLGLEKDITQTQMKKMAFNTRAENIDGETCRLGIDGWFYEPDATNPGDQYSFSTVAYKRFNMPN